MATIVITGANRGLGLGLAQQYLAQGHQVLATHRPGSNTEGWEGLVENASGQLTPVALDLQDDRSIEQCAQGLKAAGPIDIMINNAGATNHQPLGSWTRAAFIDSYQSNAVGPALLIQALRDNLAQGARLIQLSSGLASIAENIGADGPFEEYAMSKAALNLLTHRLAHKLAERGIITAAISPGWVKTDMGGNDAPTSVEQAAQAIAQTIEQLQPEQSGGFFDLEGAPIRW
ncbi:SDR family NAD(P)-dependent oxidoreductase [Marinimicrobium sp. ARAG 43.8]|uniref:SDR family NAD(P)-dependent oxidoreductase n=1 Tax=Marinimicrobium sp. ARAG 43.8 TaxID=3418719 RepID=UPI003CF39F25